MPEPTAVILLQMGGPDSLDSVAPFLLNLFTDRDIIRIGPAFLQPFIARFIVRRRAPKARGYYEKIGGKSPIRELTEGQAGALETRLGDAYRCFVAMRYSRPSTLDAVTAAGKAGCARIIALSLYPHYSRATTGSSINELNRALSASTRTLTVTFIDRFFDHPLYIDSLVEKIEEGLARFSDRSEVDIVFSAHSLPKSYIDAGDPYLAHIQETVRLVVARLGRVNHYLAFQSRAGPVKWLEPSTEELLRERAGHGCKRMLLVPLSFVSDHIETLYEVDIQYAEAAAALGIKEFHRSPSLNSSPLFIDCLAALARREGV